MALLFSRAISSALWPNGLPNKSASSLPTMIMPGHAAWKACMISIFCASLFEKTMSSHLVSLSFSPRISDAFLKAMKSLRTIFQLSPALMSSM